MPKIVVMAYKRFALMRSAHSAWNEQGEKECFVFLIINESYSILYTYEISSMFHMNSSMGYGVWGSIRHTANGMVMMVVMVFRVLFGYKLK